LVLWRSYAGKVTISLRVNITLEYISDDLSFSCCKKQACGGAIMSDDPLSIEERTQLLEIARQALELGVLGEPLEPLDLKSLPLQLRQPGVSFVTLTLAGQLRGCIGALQASQPLAEDVREHAVAAALNDYRFPSVRPGELAEIKIEISRLTTPKPLAYQTPEDLLSKLRPGIDGVVLRDGLQRSTFLPQVWEKLPAPELFLGQLCLKMGAPSDLWRKKKLDVSIYQVEEFHE
jgi:AmmeMemoRadiSam system protein A